MIGFSPDGEWFAYFTGSAYEGYPYRLHLISAKGNELTTIPAYEIVPIQKGDYAGAWSVRWLTNHYMLIAISAPMENCSDRLIYAVIDPFTGKWNESILENLPDRATARGHEGAVAFDQSLSRVLYAANMQGDNDFSIVSPVLWDTKHQMELWRGRELYDSSFTYGRRGSASWSPDASQVAFVGPENPDFSGELRSSQQGIYLLDRSGDSLRVITSFLATKGIFSTGGLSWSPDGRYLAFQLLLRTDTNEEATYSIYLYDLETDQVIYLCSREQTVYFDTDAPVWSPDGHYLAYTSTNYSSEGSQVIKSLNVVNIHTGEVVTVAEPIGQLGGWSGVWP
jgi:WD40 repeat protein